MSETLDETRETVEIPRDSYDLIKLLDRSTPHLCIGVNESLEDAHRYAGQRQFVDDLLAWMEDEETAKREDDKQPESGSLPRILPKDGEITL